MVCTSDSVGVMQRGQGNYGIRLWIDAICIGRPNNAERSGHVQAMFDEFAILSASFIPGESTRMEYLNYPTAPVARYIRTLLHIRHSHSFFITKVCQLDLSHYGMEEAISLLFPLALDIARLCVMLLGTTTTISWVTHTLFTFKEGRCMTRLTPSQLATSFPKDGI